MLLTSDFILTTIVREFKPFQILYSKVSTLKDFDKGLNDNIFTSYTVLSFNIYLRILHYILSKVLAGFKFYKVKIVVASKVV